MIDRHSDSVHTSNAMILLQVRLGNCVINMTDIESTRTIGSLCTVVANLLIREYQPHVLECNVTGISYRSRVLKSDCLLSSILRDSNRAIVAVSECRMLLNLAKPLPIKFILDKQIIVSDHLNIECFDLNSAHECVRDLVVRGMTIASIDGVTDAQSMTQLIKNRQKQNFMLEMFYNGDATEIGNADRADSKIFGTVDIEVVSVTGLASKEGEKCCIAISIGNQFSSPADHSEHIRVKNGHLNVNYSRSIALPHGASHLRIDVFSSHMLRGASLLSSAVLQLSEMRGSPGCCFRGQLELIRVNCIDEAATHMDTCTGHVQLVAKMCTRDLVRLFDPIAQRPGDLVFHQHITCQWSENLDMVTDSPNMVQMRGATEMLSRGVLFCPTASADRTLPSPCLFQVTSKAEAAHHNTFFNRDTVDSHHLSTRVGTLFSGTIKKMYSPEHVLNILSSTLHAEQVLAAHDPLGSEAISIFDNGHKNRFSTGAAVTTVAAEFTFRISMSGESGEFVEFVVPSEEDYWDWFEALVYAFVARSHPWSAEALTYVDDIQSSLVWNQYKKAKSGFSIGETREKKRPVSVSLNVGEALLQVFAPRHTHSGHNDTPEPPLLTVHSNSVKSVQFSHSWRDFNESHQIRVDITGGIAGAGVLDAGADSAFVLKVGVSGRRDTPGTPCEKSLFTLPSQLKRSAVRWKSSLLFDVPSLSGMNVTMQLYAVPMSMQSIESRHVMGDTNDYDESYLASGSSASFDMAGLTPVSDVSSVDVNDAQTSSLQCRATDRALLGNKLRTSPRMPHIPLFAGDRGTDRIGMTLTEISVTLDPSQISLVKKGVYAVVYLVKNVSGFVKASKIRTDMKYDLPLVWKGEWFFESDHDDDTICIRLKQHGAFRATLIGEYTLNAFQVPHSAVPHVCILSSCNDHAAPLLRVMALSGSITSASPTQHEERSNNHIIMDIAYEVTAGEFTFDSNCAWPARVYLQSPSTGVSEAESCHFYVTDRAVNLICPYVEQLTSSHDAVIDFVRFFTTPNLSRSEDSQHSGKRHDLAHVLEYQIIQMSSDGDGDATASASQFIDMSLCHKLPFASLSDVRLPEDYVWNGKWWLDSVSEREDSIRQEESEDWVYGADLWCVLEGFVSCNDVLHVRQLASDTDRVRVRLWKRHIIVPLDSIAALKAKRAVDRSLTKATAKHRMKARRMQYSRASNQTGEIDTSPSPHAHPLKTCIPLVDGCIAIPYTSLLSAVVLCPSVLKCMVLVDVLLLKGEIVRVPMKIVVGQCPAARLCTLIQDNFVSQHIRNKVSEVHRSLPGEGREEHVLDVIHYIVHSLSVLDNYADESSAYVRNDIVWRKRQLVGLLKGVRRRYAHLFSQVFDAQQLSRSESGIPDAEQLELQTVESTITQARYYCQLLSKDLRRCVTSQPEGIDSDTRDHVKEILGGIVNFYYSKVIDVVMAATFTRDEVLRLKGQREKLQLLYFIMKEDDVVDRILKRYLPLLGLESHPPALLTSVLGLEKLIGRFANVLEDELKHWCERVLQHHLAEGEKGVGHSSGLIWPITQQQNQKYRSSKVAGHGMFSSSLPEDVVSAIRHFIESVMSDLGGADEGSSGGLDKPVRPTRKCAKNDMSAHDHNGGSHHSKIRVAQFQSYVMGATASTLVWFRDVLSSLILSHERSARENDQQVVASQFDCAVINDCVRVVQVHIPSLELDFDSVIQDAAHSGISMSAAYEGFLELLVSAVDRIVSGVFEDGMDALRQRHGDGSRSQFNTSFSLKNMWAASRANIHNAEGSTASPFAILCDIAETALICLKSWLHPIGFSILLANLIGDLSFLLVSIVREMALECLMHLLRVDAGPFSASGSEPLRDDYQSGWNDEYAKYFREDVATIESLHFSFCESQDVAVELALIQERTREMHIVSAASHLEALRQFESLLTASIPNMETALTTYSDATASFDESQTQVSCTTENPSQLSHSSSSSSKSSNIVATFVNLLEINAKMQASTTSALKIVLLLHAESPATAKILMTLCVNHLKDESQHRVDTRQSLLSRAFKNMPQSFNTFPHSESVTLSPPPAQPCDSPSSIDKTLNRLRGAISGPALRRTHLMVAGILPSALRADDSSVLRSDDVLNTLANAKSRVGVGGLAGRSSMSAISSIVAAISRKDPSPLPVDSSLTDPPRYLRVKVVEACGLRNVDRIGKSSPYVTVQLIRGGGAFRDKIKGGEGMRMEDTPLLKTHHIRNDLSPTFNHEMCFNVMSLVGLQLDINVYSWSRYLRHVMMASKTVNISGIASSRHEDLWLKLDAPLTGTISTTAGIRHLELPLTSPTSPNRKSVETDSPYGSLHLFLSWNE